VLRRDSAVVQAIAVRVAARAHEFTAQVSKLSSQPCACTSRLYRHPLG
jgi:hypothetical protein